MERSSLRKKGKGKEGEGRTEGENEIKKGELLRK